MSDGFREFLERCALPPERTETREVDVVVCPDCCSNHFHVDLRKPTIYCTDCGTEIRLAKAARRR